MAEEISPISHLEKFIAGQEPAISHLEKIIALYGSGSGSGTGGTTNYNALLNKPSINGVELSGNKTLAQLGIDLSKYTTKDKAISSIKLVDAIPTGSIGTTTEKCLELTYADGTTIIYVSVNDLVDKFEEEYNTEKVIFVHPKQVTQLRKDADFTSADKYVNGNYIAVNGEIGKICNCRVVVSKRVKEDAGHTGYINPIVKLNFDTETEENTPALTIFLKKGVAVETGRDIDKQINMIRASEHYVVALTDESKVVLATFKK